jgi:hypothetical protein
MAGTAYVPIKPFAAEFLASAFPQRDKINGSGSPATVIPILKFDASANECAYWRFVLTGYTSGNLTLDIFWFADTATSGDIVWGGAIACITPDTDTQDVTTDSLATENTVTDTQLGTTARRLQKCTVTISNLDGAADGDEVVLRIRRLSAGNTMTGDGCLLQARLSYAT